MVLKKLNIAPGMNREGTQYTSNGKWYDGDKVRFRKGLPESIGGWEKYTAETFQGVCRSLFHWHTLTGVRYITVGTNLKYYILSGNSFKDITPIRSGPDNLGNNPLDTTSGSAVVVVNHTAHGATNNDFVTLAAADATNGIPADELNAEHQLTYIDANSYSVTVTTTASSTGSGGGTTPITATYQINTGITTGIGGPGWGAGTWSRGTWGSAATITTSDTLRIWHQDHWGEDLVFNIKGGPLYFWDASGGTGVRGTLLSAESGADNVPVLALQALVSQIDRHLVTYGCNELGTSTMDPLLIRWSDQESLFDFDPTAVNTSGSQRLSIGSSIVAALNLAKGETLVWTDEALYSQQYIGPPFTYGFNFIAGDIDIVSTNAAAFVGSVNGGKTYWMSGNNFYVYDGTVQALKCDLLDYVFDDINKGEYGQIFVAPNEHFSEISWHYCSADSSTIDRYVTYNYEEGLWYFGTLARTAWMDYKDSENPISTSVSGGILYKHESGVDDDGSALNSYIESPGIELEDGDSFIFMHRLVPDIKFRGTTGVTKTGNLITKKRRYPQDSLDTHKTQAITESTRQIFPRMRTREAVIKFESNTLGVGWRLGHIRADIKPDGKR